MLEQAHLTWPDQKFRKLLYFFPSQLLAWDFKGVNFNLSGLLLPAASKGNFHTWSHMFCKRGCYPWPNIQQVGKIYKMQSCVISSWWIFQAVSSVALGLFSLSCKAFFLVCVWALFSPDTKKGRLSGSIWNAKSFFVCTSVYWSTEKLLFLQFWFESWLYSRCP